MDRKRSGRKARSRQQVFVGLKRVPAHSIEDDIVFVDVPFAPLAAARVAHRVRR